MTQLQYVQYKNGDKVYGKYQVVVPRDIIQKAGWKPKEEVRFNADRKGRIIATAHAPEPKLKKMTYEEFSNYVLSILESTSKGLTWSEIRVRNPALPLKPHALWVRMLESDIHLERETRSGRSVWSIDRKTSATLS